MRTTATKPAGAASSSTPVDGETILLVEDDNSSQLLEEARSGLSAGRAASAPVRNG